MKAAARLGLEVRSVHEKSYTEIGGGADDLPLIVEVIKASGRRVVIEDFHYLGESCRFKLAQDLKAFWDFEVFFIIVGIWRHMNYLTYLNADLAGRITELSLHWSSSDLDASLKKGTKALNCYVSDSIRERIVKDSYGNIGLLQSLSLELFHECKICVEQHTDFEISDLKALENAGMNYAAQLEAIYTKFAERVSKGIRQRSNSTKIYAYAMWSIFDCSDDFLMSGVSCDRIYQESHKRELRIQKGNLRAVLRKF